VVSSKNGANEKLGKFSILALKI